MSNNDSKSTGKELTNTDNQAMSKNSLTLGSTTALDLTGLTVEQVQELRVKYAAGMIDVQKKAAELNIDVVALEKTLSTMADQTRQISQQGDSITISHSQDSSLGRTEVMMGNTDKAASGKLSRTATGEPDRTIIYIVAAIIVVLILAFAFGK
jgi:hypothetical protein